MKKKKIINKSGVTLTEISLAVLIFALTAIPLYYAINYGSNEEIQLNKISIANKILEAFKDEVKNLDYNYVDDMCNDEKIETNELPPNSFQSLFNAQKEYKDFNFTGNAKKTTTNDVESIKINAEISWTNGFGQKSNQKITFIKVKQ